MTFVFNVEGKPKYKLIKQDPGWELTYYDEGGKLIEKGRWQGQHTKAGWKKMAQGQGMFPHNIRHAMDMMMDDIILTHGCGEVPVVDGLREIKSQLAKIEGTLSAKAEEAESLLVV